MSTRSELKENILAHKLEGFIAWVLANRGTVATGAGIAVAAVLIGSVFVLRSQEKREANLTRLAMSESLVSQRQFDRAALALQDLRTSVNDNALVARVVYYQGVAALGLKQYDQAETFFTDAVTRSAGTPLKPLALANLGFAQEERKEFDAAAQTYGRFMAESGEHFLAPRIQLALGRSLAAAGKTEDAKKALGQLIDLYPTSHWAENARSIMDKYKSR